MAAKWMDKNILHEDHAKDLETAAAHHEFHGKLSRQDAEAKAHTDYKRNNHLEAAAHHLHGLRAAASLGEREDGAKHNALYVMHLKAAGENHRASPSQEVLSKIPTKAWTGFKNHKGDALLGDASLDKAEKILYKQLVKE